MRFPRLRDLQALNGGDSLDVTDRRFSVFRVPVRGSTLWCTISASSSSCHRSSSAPSSSSTRGFFMDPGGLSRIRHGVAPLPTTDHMAGGVAIAVSGSLRGASSSSLAACRSTLSATSTPPNTRTFDSSTPFSHCVCHPSPTSLCQNILPLHCLRWQIRKHDLSFPTESKQSP